MSEYATEPKRLTERPALTDVDLRVGRRCLTSPESPPGPRFYGKEADGLGCIRAVGHSVTADGHNHVGFRFNPQLFYTEYWTW
jgi:hypothetical protein